MATNTLADVTALIGNLTNNLGVTQQQAEGGTAAIFNAAKPNLSLDQFSQLTDTIPGLTDLLGSAAPAGGASGLGSLAGKAGSMLGDSGSVSSTAGLVDSFSQLGLSPDMVGKFTGVVLDYVNNIGGSDMMNMLQQALL